MSRHEVSLLIKELPEFGNTVLIGALDAAIPTFRFSRQDIGAGSIILPRDHPDRLTICDPPNWVETLIEVHVKNIDTGATALAGAFFAADYNREWNDPEWIEIYGEDIRSAAGVGIIPNYDSPADPTVYPDWVYGGDDTAGSSFANGDMENSVDLLEGNGDAELGILKPLIATTNVGDFVAPDDFEVTDVNPITGVYSFWCDPDIRHSGYKIPFTADPGGRYLFTCDFQSTNSGKRYTAGMRAIGTGVVAHHTNSFIYNGYAMAELDNVPRNPSANGLPGGSSDGTVQTFTLDVTLGDNQTSSEVFVYYDHHDGTDGAPFRIDNLTLVQIDGGASVLPPWTVNAQTGTVTLEVETTIVRNGTQSAKVTITGTTNPNDGVFRQLVNGFTPTAPVTFGAWVRHEEGVNVDVRAVVKNKSGPWAGSKLHTVPTGTWTWVDVTAAPDEEDAWVQIRLGQSGSAILYIDDATLFEGLAAASPGQILLDTFTAMQAAGDLPWLTMKTVDATTDSDGAVWANATIALTVARGQSLADLLARLGDWGYEWDIVWDGTDWDLRVYNPGGLGISTTTVILEGDATPDGSVSTSNPRASVVHAEGGDGSWVRTVDAGLQAAIGTRTAYVYDRDIASSSSVSALAAQQILRHKAYPRAARVAITNDAEDVPFIDYRYGDSIEAITDEFTGPANVEAISWDGQNDTWIIEINDRTLTQPAAQARTVNALAVAFKRQVQPQSALAATLTDVADPLTTPFVIVAASDAPSWWLEHADFICDGESDHEEIQAAIDLWDGVAFGRVFLTPGTFYSTPGAGASSPLIQISPATTSGCVGLYGAQAIGVTPNGSETAHGTDSGTHIFLNDQNMSPGVTDSVILINNGELRHVSITTPAVQNHGILLAAQNNCKLSDLALYSFNEYPLEIRAGQPENVYRDITISQLNLAGAALNIAGAVGCVFEHITVSGGAGHGITFDGFAGLLRNASVYACVFRDIYFISSGTTGDSAFYFPTPSDTAAWPSGDAIQANVFDGIRLASDSTFDQVFEFEASGAWIGRNEIGIIANDAGIPLFGPNAISAPLATRRIIQTATADLPTASALPNELRYDTTVGALKYSDGTSWITIGP